MGKRGPALNSVRLEMTEERKAAFLAALRNSGGVWSAACRAVSPHSPEDTHNPPCDSSFRNLLKRDPAFAAQVEEVLEQCRDDVEAEIHRRAQIGVETRVYQKGQQVFNKDGSEAKIRRYSDTLLLKRAAALMPDKYGEKRTVDINHHGSGGAAVITSADLIVLNETQRDQLMAILTRIQDARAGNVPAIENKTGETVDADFTEVEDEKAELLEW